MLVTQEIADKIALAIAKSNATVLAQRNVADDDGGLANELARNAAQDLVFILEGIDDDLIRCRRCGEENGHPQDMPWCTPCVQAHDETKAVMARRRSGNLTP